MSEANVLDTPEQIERYRKLVIWKCVQVDHKFNGKLRLARTYRLSKVKAEFNLKGDRHSVYEQLTKMFLADGTLVGCPNHADRLPSTKKTNLCDECAAQGGLKVVK